MQIRVEGVGKTFPSGGRTLHILTNVELQVDSGDVAAIVGPSGSGKTTLLGIMAGLDAPTTGEVWLGDTPLTRLSEDERAAFRSTRVGFVFQTFQLLPSLTALENVQVPLELAPAQGRSSPRQIRDRAAALLDRVGLGDRLTHYPIQLSGGEQQRVALARAFVSQPSLLFADEPTGNLDQETGSRIVELLEELNREQGATLVLVTHDLELAARAKRRFRITAGHLRAIE